MRAIQIDAFGDAGRMRIAGVPEPTPGKGELSIRVGGAGVGRWDVKERCGLIAGPDKLPLTLGWECAGVVVSCGEGVAGYAQGAGVLAYAQDRGAYAEVVACPAEWCAPKPASMTMAQAAALPVCGLTAIQVLNNELKLQPGERLLILGAGGTTGFLAAQLAVAMGVTVMATAGRAHHEQLRAFGVGAVVDSRRGKAVPDASQLDAILDTVGPTTLAEALPSLRPGGRAVGIAGIPEHIPAGVSVRQYYVQGDSEALERLAVLVAGGRLILPRITLLRLEEAARAHELIESGAAGGKLVLVP
jgi:NADPH:quinone reductase-like Zn-dependent oxidoreductase